MCLHVFTTEVFWTCYFIWLARKYIQYKSSFYSRYLWLILFYLDIVPLSSGSNQLTGFYSFLSSLKAWCPLNCLFFLCCCMYSCCFFLKLSLTAMTGITDTYLPICFKKTYFLFLKGVWISRPGFYWLSLKSWSLSLFPELCLATVLLLLLSYSTYSVFCFLLDAIPLFC